MKTKNYIHVTVFVGIAGLSTVAFNNCSKVSNLNSSRKSDLDRLAQAFSSPDSSNTSLPTSSSSVLPKTDTLNSPQDSLLECGFTKELQTLRDLGWGFSYLGLKNGLESDTRKAYSFDCINRLFGPVLEVEKNQSSDTHQERTFIFSKTITENSDKTLNRYRYIDYPFVATAETPLAYDQNTVFRFKLTPGFNYKRCTLYTDTQQSLPCPEQLLQQAVQPEGFLLQGRSLGTGLNARIRLKFEFDYPGSVRDYESHFIFYLQNKTSEDSLDINQGVGFISGVSIDSLRPPELNSTQASTQASSKLSSVHQGTKPPAEGLTYKAGDRFVFTLVAQAPSFAGVNSLAVARLKDEFRSDTVMLDYASKKATFLGKYSPQLIDANAQIFSRINIEAFLGSVRGVPFTWPTLVATTNFAYFNSISQGSTFVSLSGSRRGFYCMAAGSITKGLSQDQAMIEAFKDAMTYARYHCLSF